MNTTRTTLDTFTRAYIECALWSITNEYDQSDLAPETLAKMIEDCQAFQADNASDLEACELSVDKQGHDFWLTRNRDGAGFWDRKHINETADAALNKLTDAAHAYGSFDLYVGDDGLIYGN